MAALTFEDALVEEGKEEPRYSTYARVMVQSFCAGRSIVAYHTLPLMRPGRRPKGWDEWGHPWALMDIAKKDIPANQEVWRYPHTEGRLIVDLVRHDKEPYYFPDAPALLRVLHRNAKAEGVTVAQPGAQGWNARDLEQVEQLLRPHTYPPCATVSACLRKWVQFVYRGEGYREGPPMPGGTEPITFWSESWDYPEPIVPPVLTGRREERPVEETKATVGSRPDSGSEGTLREKWQATDSRDPPAWVDKGFAGIKEHMKQQAAAAEGTREEEVTLYCPRRNLPPQQQMRALLDPQLPGYEYQWYAP